MREAVRYGFILSLICVVASASLSVVNSFTKPRIIAQVKAEEEIGLKEVLPEAGDFRPVRSEDETIYYKAYRKAKFVGVVFKAGGKGYSSTIETMVGMLKDGTVTAIKMLSQNETPGLGSRIAESGFIGQFVNKKNLNDIQAITGATISSRAVIDAVRIKAEEIKELIKDE